MNLGNTLWNENDQNPLDPPLAKGGKGGLKTSKIEFVTLIVNHAQKYDLNVALNF